MFQSDVPKFSPVFVLHKDDLQRFLGYFIFEKINRVFWPKWILVTSAARKRLEAIKFPVTELSFLSFDWLRRECRQSLVQVNQQTHDPTERTRPQISFPCSQNRWTQYWSDRFLRTPVNVLGANGCPHWIAQHRNHLRLLDAGETADWLVLCSRNGH